MLDTSREEISSDEYLYMLKFSNKQNPIVDITVKSKTIGMTIDTGASINVIDEEKFKRLGNIKLSKPGITAYTYGSRDPVQFHGKFKTVLESKSALVVDDVYVVKKNNSGCLMSFMAAKNLGLISLHIDCINSQNKDGGSDNTTENDDQLNDILNAYAQVFRGLGKLKDSKICLNIDESITPVALKQRRIPFHIRDRVDKALDQLLEDDVNEQVPENQPTPWVSPIFAIPQKDETIRLCLDMRKPNEAIKRTRFPIPTSKDIDILLNGASTEPVIFLN